VNKKSTLTRFDRAEIVAPAAEHPQAERGFQIKTTGPDREFTMPEWVSVLAYAPE
jgi:hypothetical protein